MMEDTTELLNSLSQENVDLLRDHNERQRNPFRSCMGKIHSVISMITVEPCIFLFLVSFSLQSILLTDFIIEKTCSIYYNYSSEICNNLSNNEKEENKVQQYANQITLYAYLIETLPSLFVLLFLGTWSDKHGRKLPILIPFVGNAFNSMLLMVNVYLWYLPPSYILIASIPKGLCGGFNTLAMLCYSYITDLSNEEHRTMRIAIIDYSFSLGPLAAFSLESLMYKNLGFMGLFGLSGSVSLLCTVYVIFAVIETKGYYKGTRFWCFEKSPVIENELSENDGNIFHHVIEALTVTFKKRPMYKRCQLLLCIAALSIFVSTFADGSIEYLFTNKQLKWAYVDYLHYVTYQSGFACIAAPSLIGLLTVKLKIQDLVLSITGLILKTVSDALEAFITHGWMLYVLNAVGFLGFLSVIGIRSTISKLVPSDEIGKVFSFLSCLELLLPLSTKYAFITIYNATLDILPGTFKLVCSFLVFVTTMLLCWFQVLNRKMQLQEELLHSPPEY